MMLLNGAFDPILCRAFPSFLDGAALHWFSSLSAASAIYTHDSNYLSTIKQGQHESLHDYIPRFTKVAMEIPNLTADIHLHAIKSRLRAGKFQETITVNKPKTLAEFREKAQKQMEIEELRQARNSEKPNNNKNDNRSNMYHSNGNNRDSKKSFQPTPRFEENTQFNTKKEDIIKEILSSKLIKPPKNAENYKDQKNADRSKYRTFHQKHGHNTEHHVIANDLLVRLAR
ncbi:hypothetical protein PIB30_063910 [Stylosanthes scabra]|uniref:Retrotransposon gag domain-containing protein n=1 Tax=Stylosanthes scabra TaxID=79078 RepID=A0ABU6TN60_9FABA|nr:hypothetical protein [Stylosanthes scabra]